MKVVMISKALVVGAYQRKLEEIARQPDVELACIVPPAWRQDGRELRLERAHTAGYDLIVEPIRWNGSFHLFYFPGLGKQLARLAPDVVHVDEEPYNLATFLSTRLALRQAARPNCSFQFGRVSEGSTRASRRRSCAGTSVEGTGSRTTTRPASPSLAARKSSGARSGPWPNSSSRQSPSNPATASSRTQSPFSSTRRPR